MHRSTELLRVGGRRGLVLSNRLIQQNLILFAGGLAGGVGSFVYHAVAGRILGPALYGRVAFLIAAYSVGAAVALVLSITTARYVATLAARGEHKAIASTIALTIRLVVVGGLCVAAVSALFAGPVATFEHLGSSAPVIFLGSATAAVWLLAIPRGVLQGLQRFGALALNLAVEPVVRVSALAVLLLAGYAVTGAIAAILLGVAVSFLIGLNALRDLVVKSSTSVPKQTMARLSLTVAVGIVGIQLLFNQDVVLAEHYLNSHEGGIYGSVNKIGTIVFYLTLSVSQVLFPRVVEAVSTRRHPGRILTASAGILSLLGTGALLVFGIAPGVVVGLLYGPGFTDAGPYVVAAGVIGLTVSLNNLLVQFFMAVGDKWFIPILVGGCVVEAMAIALFHAGVGQVVGDVLVSLLVLVSALGIRSYVLLRKLDTKGLGESDSAFVQR